MSCGTGIYKFSKVGDKILLSNGDIEALIPECNVSFDWIGGTNTIRATILNCKVSPSLISYTMDEDETGTIVINNADVQFPLSFSAAELADKLTLLKDFEPIMQGGTNGQVMGKIADSDFAYGFLNI